jgi:hypothetical protein
LWPLHISGIMALTRVNGVKLDIIEEAFKAENPL